MSKTREAKKNLAENNRGITLVELMVTVAILAVVLGVIIGFFMTSISLYQRVSREANLQNEAQLTISQIQSLVVNASNGVGIGSGKGDDEVVGDELYVYDHDDVTFEIIHIYKEGTKLLYCEIPYTKDADGNTVEGPDKTGASLLSNYVKSFKVDMTNLKKNNSIDITLDFENKGRSYSTTNTLYMRNHVAQIISGSADAYLQEDYQAAQDIGATAITVSPTEVYAWPGQRLISPFVAYGTKDGADLGQVSVIWNVPDDDTVSVNRSTGVVSIGENARGAIEVEATTVGSINNSGGNTDLYVRGSAMLYIKSYDGISLTHAEPESDTNHKTYVSELEVTGNGLQTSVDMGSNPVVAAGSTVSATFEKSTTSSEGHLRWIVRIKRPSDYQDYQDSGKTYTLNVSYTLNGVTKTATLGGIIFTPASDEQSHEIDRVRLVDGSNVYESGSGLVSEDTNRGVTKNVRMEAHYKNTADSAWVTMDTDDWSLTVDNSSVLVTRSGNGYRLACDVKNYTGTVVVNCSTRYAGSDGKTSAGPGLQLKFNPVTITLDNGVPTSQTVYPVTRGTTEKMSFVIKNVDGASVYLIGESGAGSASAMRTSVSGTSASVTINSSATAGQARTYTFGVQLASGEKLDASICCVVSLKPDEANLYTSTGQKLGGTFIPLANTIRSYDSTKNVPTGSQTVDLYLLDGTKITYKANGKISLYDMSFNGTSYFYGNPSGIPGWAKY